MKKANPVKRRASISKFFKDLPGQNEDGQVWYGFFLVTQATTTHALHYPITCYACPITHDAHP
jgi:hypothetical protein